jgi:aminopeptidase-like protein
MPGTKFPMKIASSFNGTSVVDQAIREACAHQKISWRQVGWRRGAGNDETVWEAPGYEIPFVEVSRCNKTFKPFRTYHTSEDNLKYINWKNVQIFYRTIIKTIEYLEKKEVLERTFDGLPCLSNPKLKLYFERKDPSVRKKKISDKLGYLNDCILRYFNGQVPVSYIMKKHKIGKKEINKIIKQFKDKRLVK